MFLQDIYDSALIPKKDKVLEARTFILCLSVKFRNLPFTTSGRIKSENKLLMYKERVTQRSYVSIIKI